MACCSNSTIYMQQTFIAMKGKEKGKDRKNEERYLRVAVKISEWGAV